MTVKNMNKQRLDPHFKQNDRLFEAVCSNATVAIFLMDERQRCVYLNPAAELLTGYCLAEVRDRPLHDVIHHTRPDGSPYPLEDCPIDRAFPENHQEQGEEVFVHKNGSFYPVAYTASPIREEGIVVGTIIEVRGIQKEKDQARAHEEEARTLEILNKTGALLAAKVDLEDVLQAVTDAATELTGAQFGAFFYNSTNNEGELYQLYTLSGVPREAFQNFPMPRNTHVFGPTFRGEGVVRVDDITVDPRYGRNDPFKGMPPGHLPVRSYLAVPVISRTGEVLGGLFFGHERAGVFSERAERIMVGVAAQAAVAVDNARLFQRVQAELAERKRAEEIQRLLNDELNHRVKNMLASVQAIAAQTLRGASTEDRKGFEDRLLALSDAHGLLLRKKWEYVGLADLAATALEPFKHSPTSPPRYRVEGDNISVSPKQALALVMALHELATNAVKHGALSNEHGRLAVTWQAATVDDRQMLRLQWEESGGPPVEQPMRRGFGSRLIERGLSHELGGNVELRFNPGGIVCVVEFPVSVASPS
ncbi:MAG TPA: HWE histidine kinase domain-containing protein [Pseudorhizobium sp.]|jgi:PAS domain S-box-containing protein|nr:HWE histidine kinase domain-containing protein [Pseudorhizobium sp.]